MEIETRNWVIVADEATAEFYTRDGSRGPLESAQVLENDAARAKLEDLLADGAGRSFDSHGKGRHALVNRVDKKEIAAIRFADEVIARLVQQVQRGHVVRYVIVAPPRFLGQLRKALQKHRIDPPARMIAKDLVGREPAVIAEALERT